MTIYQRKLQLEHRKQVAKDTAFFITSALEYIAVWAVYMVIITRMLRIM